MRAAEPAVDCLTRRAGGQHEPPTRGDFRPATSESSRIGRGGARFVAEKRSLRRRTVETDDGDFSAREPHAGVPTHAAGPDSDLHARSPGLLDASRSSGTATHSWHRKRPDQPAAGRNRASCPSAGRQHRLCAASTQAWSRVMARLFSCWHQHRSSNSPPACTRAISSNISVMIPPPATGSPGAGNPKSSSMDVRCKDTCRRSGPGSTGTMPTGGSSPTTAPSVHPRCCSRFVSSSSQGAVHVGHRYRHVLPHAVRGCPRAGVARGSRPYSPRRGAALSSISTDSSVHLAVEGISRRRVAAVLVRRALESTQEDGYCIPPCLPSNGIRRDPT